MLKEIVAKNRMPLSELLAQNTDLGYFQIQKIIKKRNVKVNGSRVGADVSVNAGDVVYAYLADREKDAIEIVYQDDNILVVNKPSGIETEGEDSVCSRLNDMLTDVEVFPVHRLDRNTMGLLVFATNKNAEKELLNSFKEREIDKTYLTIVVGAPKTPHAKLKAYHFKDAKKSLVYISDKPKPGYVPIETHYRLVKRLGEFSLLEVKLISGKTHQIRAHLAFIGLPVLGDGKYGVNKVNRAHGVKSQLLFCVKITFHFKQGPLKYLDGKSVVLSVDPAQYYKR